MIALAWLFSPAGRAAAFFKPPTFGNHTRNKTMTLPLFWRRAGFSVSDAAEILAVPEDTLRTWLAREPTGQYIGMRGENGRVLLSGCDIYFFAIVRDLSGFGVPIRTAMREADAVAGPTFNDPPPDLLLVVRRHGAHHEFESTEHVDVTSRPFAVLPLRSVFEPIRRRCVERAE